jgi:two-component system, NtrC family, sensor histidine kinase PilS
MHDTSAAVDPDAPGAADAGCRNDFVAFEATSSDGHDVAGSRHRRRVEATSRRPCSSFCNAHPLHFASGLGSLAAVTAARSSPGQACHPPAKHAMRRTEGMLRWLYTGRLVVATAIFVAALANWLGRSTDVETLLATIALLSALFVTGAGVWWTEVRGRSAGRNFLYGQLVYDVLLVTVAVHVTGGATSPLPPLYILVITAGALLLPLPGGMLIGALASLLFFTDLVLTPASDPTSADLLRIALFGVVAVATAAVGERLRRAGSALGAIELELRQLRLDTNDILAAIDTGLVTVDGAGRLSYMNEAASGLLQLPGEWTGQPVLEQLDRTAPGLGTLVRRTAATRVPVGRFEIRRRTPAGERFLGVRTTVLDREGMPWVTAVLQDVTESRQIEDLVRRAERLQAVAELGASLAHEIRNPLASISSAVEQLAGERLSGDDRDLLRRLVVTESDRLSRLLAEFMEFSKVEMRRWASVDFKAIVCDAVELAARHPDRGPGVRIDYHPPEGAAQVDGDPDLLHRTVFNLVLNAVQHAGRDGVVTIAIDRPRDLPPSVQLEAPVRLTVRDTGPGVPEEDLTRMFDPFFTTRNGGTGLGLAMVHRAVEAHRGAILVDNVPTGGASFTLYLPAHAEREGHDGIIAH